jgi:hypothetical protein
MGKRMRLAQFLDHRGDRRVAAITEGRARLVAELDGTYELATEAADRGITIAALVAARGLGEPVDLDAAEADGRLLPPIDHPDAAHVIVTGTGLTHLGSAEGRDAMHRKLAGAETLTDSMRMFRMGLEGGKPAPGEAGVQPEWFYKGDGSILAAPGAPLAMPEFAADGGEEPEIVGIYIVAADGTPCRIGYALGNEFSDHVTERENYLWLAHSKLRACAVGPELRLGDLPAHVEGASRIRRDGRVFWEKPFLSGEANMSHSIANLEQHHFKYRLFRRPGDVHVHFFGTATLSFSDGVRTAPGDVFEIDCAEFGRPLRNPLGTEPAPAPAIRSL